MNRNKQNILTAVFLLLSIWSFWGCTKDIFELQVEDTIIKGSPSEGNSSSIFPEVGRNVDYFVQLNGIALQPGDKGMWEIKSGRLHEEFVYFSDHTAPNTKFYGIPDEGYVLEWVVNRKGKELREEVKVKIKSPEFHIHDRTPSDYKTKIKLSVYEHLRGKWSVDKAIAWMNPVFPYVSSDRIEENTSMDFQTYENTEYHIKWTYTLFGKEFVLDTTITTGAYQQVEALADIGLTRDHNAVTWDKNKNVIGINMQSSRYGHIFDDWESYPALRALKHLKKLNLYASSIATFPELFTTYYLGLEELNMKATGYKIEIPASIANLKKLKKFHWGNLWASHIPLGRLTYPEEFGQLENLEELHTEWGEGIILPQSFGKLKNLKVFTGTYYKMPEGIGNLKNLRHLEARFQTGGILSSLADATALESLRFSLYESGQTRLPSNIGQLKNLHYLEIGGQQHIGDIPQSIGNLNKLDTLWIADLLAGEIPETFGNLTNLKLLYLSTTARSLPQSIGNLTGLKGMHLYGTNIRKLPESFGNLSNLDHLYLSTTLESLPETFGNLQNLKELSLANNNLATLPNSFRKLNVQNLELHYNKFKNFPKELTDMKHVLVINLRNNDIDMLPEDLLKLKNQLVYLYLDHNDRIPLENLKDIARRMFGTIIFCNEFNSYQLI